MQGDCNRHRTAQAHKGGKKFLRSVERRAMQGNKGHRQAAGHGNQEHHQGIALNHPDMGWEDHQSKADQNDKLAGPIEHRKVSSNHLRIHLAGITQYASHHIGTQQGTTAEMESRCRCDHQQGHADGLAASPLLGIMVAAKNPGAKQGPCPANNGTDQKFKSNIAQHHQGIF